MHELTILMAAALVGVSVLFTSLAGGLAGVVERSVQSVHAVKDNTSYDFRKDFNAKFIKP